MGLEKYFRTILEGSGIPWYISNWGQTQHHQQPTPCSEINHRKGTQQHNPFPRPENHQQSGITRFNLVLQTNRYRFDHELSCTGTETLQTLCSFRFRTHDTQSMQFMGVFSWQHRKGKENVGTKPISSVILWPHHRKNTFKHHHGGKIYERQWLLCHHNTPEVPSSGAIQRKTNRRLCAGPTPK